MQTVMSVAAVLVVGDKRFKSYRFCARTCHQPPSPRSSTAYVVIVRGSHNVVIEPLPQHKTSQPLLAQQSDINSKFHRALVVVASMFTQLRASAASDAVTTVGLESESESAAEQGFHQYLLADIGQVLCGGDLTADASGVPLPLVGPGAAKLAYAEEARSTLLSMARKSQVWGQRWWYHAASCSLVD